MLRTSSTREYVRFLDIACGSAAELETQILLGQALGYLDDNVSEKLLAALAEVERMLAALMHKLRDILASPTLNRRLR